MSTKVYAPNQAYNGLAAGVQFRNGVGDTASLLDPSREGAALAYFRRAGYGIDQPAEGSFDRSPDYEQVVEDRAPTSVDAAVTKDAGGVVSDAFLPPTNAGDEDPHGPLVVSPEIHASGPKGIKPGDVHVGEPAKQEADETALAELVLVEGEPHPGAVEPPPEVAGAAEVVAVKAPARKAAARRRSPKKHR